MPYSDARLLQVLNHTLWFLPNVASCYAMSNLLTHDNFFRDYNVVICAGPGAGIGVEALAPVQKAMGNPLATKTITLSCGKLTTGVTVKPWTGVFMLRNIKSPETYFQTAFRVQSPWTITDEFGKTHIMKENCYVFDFALDRALRQISDYSYRLNVHEDNPEKKVGEFISFLPVLAYDGSTMKQISAQDILDIALSGTSATLLARRWESALLVNVDNDTLKRLMANKEAMEALMKIEGFRSLNQDIETIINKSDKVKKAKAESDKLTTKEKKELSDEEKEYKSMRKQIQEKLIKFATRIPVFMYLTDYRERTLKDVITQLEPELFKKVTGLDETDFETLCTLGVFNSNLMNDAIFKFKRYEDSSLSYTGIDKHEGKEVGGWDVKLKKDEYKQLFYNQQATMKSSDAEKADALEQAFDLIAPKILDKHSNAHYGLAGEGLKAAERKTSYVASKLTEASFSEKPLPKKALDLSEVVTGATVYHKKFGKGIVVKLEAKHLYVKFTVGEKSFLFPDAFENGFFNVEDSSK
jgi:hypothetical protein